MANSTKQTTFALSRRASKDKTRNKIKDKLKNKIKNINNIINFIIKHNINKTFLHILICMLSLGLFGCV